MARVMRGDFRKLWVAQLVSASGSAVTTVALPLVAVVTLHASALQMGLLSAVSIAPHLLLGLQAGIWIDRWPLRRVLIWTDLARLVLLGSIPASAAMQALTITQLYVVAVVTGVMTLLNDTASQTMIPVLVPRGDLLRANSAALLNLNLASTVGPSAAGLLVQAFTAPFAILVDAVSYLVSTVTAYLIREPAHPARPEHAEVKLLTGLRILFGHPALRPLVTSAAVAAAAGAMQGPLTVLYLVRDLHHSPAFVGLTVTIMGAAAVLGTFVAGAWCRRAGMGVSYLSGVLLASLNGVALATGVTPLILVGQFLAGLGASLFGVPQRTLRQALAPRHLLGQVTASWRTLVIGGQAVGALLSGVLATAVGLRPTLLLATAGMVVGLTPAALSPLRNLRGLPGERSIGGN